MKETSYKDYSKRVLLDFPYLTETDVRKIMRYGFANLDKIIRANLDFFISDMNGFLAYFGKIIASRYKLLHYYKFKLAKRIRYLYIKRRVVWDNFYYFGVNNTEFERILKLNPHMQRNIKVTYLRVTLYLIFDECKMSHRNYQHFFRIPCALNKGFIVKAGTITTNKAEVISHRRTMTFDELLVNRTEYDLLNGNYTQHI